MANPFLELENVVATFESIGLNPLCKDESGTHWTSEILAITCDGHYTESFERNYSTSILMSTEGFKRLIKALNEVEFPVSLEREVILEGVIRLVLSLSPTLSVVDIVYTDTEEELDLCGYGIQN
jgi:hypothetical protein